MKKCNQISKLINLKKKNRFKSIQTRFNPFKIKKQNQTGKMHLNWFKIDSDQFFLAGI